MSSSTADYGRRFQKKRTAEAYATRFERGSRRRTDLLEQRALNRILALLGDCRTVLDVPCGAGRFLANLAENDRSVIEMDIAAPLLDLARQRYSGSAISARFLLGNASRIPLKDGSVDAVFCNRLLHHIVSAADRGLFLREFHRVTRKYLIVSFFDYLAFGRVRVWLKRVRGRKVTYAGQPTLRQFTAETLASGFRSRSVVATGPFWVAQKYFLLEKAGQAPNTHGVEFDPAARVAAS